MELPFLKTKDVVIPNGPLMGISGVTGRTFPIMTLAITKFCEACAQKRVTPDEARDIGQAIAIYAWRKRLKDDTYLDGSKPIKPYLRKVVENVLWKVRRSRLRAEALLAAFIEWRLESLDEWMNPDSRLRASDLSDVTTKVRDELPPQEAKVFEMKRDRGMSYEEISEEVGTAPSTIKGQIMNVHKKMSVALEPYDVVPKLQGHRKTTKRIAPEAT